MTIGKKILTCLGAVLVLNASMGIYGLVSASSLGRRITKLVDVNAKRLSVAGDVNTATSDLVAAERGILLRSYLNDRPGMDKYSRNWEATIEKIKSGLSKYRVLIDDNQARQQLSDMHLNLAKAELIHKELWSLATNGKAEAAGELNKTVMAPLLAKISDAGQQFADAEQPKMSAIGAQAITSVFTTRSFMLVGIVICMIVSGIAVWVIHQINGSLRKIVRDLSTGADQVASASTQIAATSQGLAQGSSEQAASLQEISASMEEMTAMASRNTENSGEATGMMEETAVQVGSSNVALQAMLASMSDMKDSSEKVAQILKSIDQIAFQTNILALNAAVEAARAGEAGMGFAVVAEEVRSLAQRSALAAKDTAALIEEAIANSNQGAEKLDQVAVSITGITRSASRVKSLVEAVSEASKQQAIGINQVSTAVTRASGITQAAAASAEESAAASEQLNGQSQTMRDLVFALGAMVDGRSADNYAQ